MREVLRFQFFSSFRHQSHGDRWDVVECMCGTFLKSFYDIWLGSNKVRHDDVVGSAVTGTTVTGTPYRWYIHRRYIHSADEWYSRFLLFSPLGLVSAIHFEYCRYCIQINTKLSDKGKDNTEHRLKHIDRARRDCINLDSSCTTRNFYKYDTEKE